MNSDYVSENILYFENENNSDVNTINPEECIHTYIYIECESLGQNFNMWYSTHQEMQYQIGNQRSQMSSKGDAAITNHFSMFQIFIKSENISRFVRIFR